MKVVVLTSARHGTAPYILNHLLENKVCRVVAVILSEGVLKKKNKHYLRKLIKIWKIGLPGAINGIRMRKWFNDDVNQRLNTSSLEEVCAKFDITLFRTSSINCQETVALMQKADAELGLSLGNGYIGKKVYSVPPYGMLNVHHEILPAYQNAQSVIWQLYNGSRFTGYTIHKIDQSIDTGDILWQEKVPINFKEGLGKTVSATFVDLLKASAHGLAYTITNFITLNATAKKQGPGQKYTTPSLRQFLRIRRNYLRLKNS